MELIEIKIPKDALVIKATVNWLLGLVGGETTTGDQNKVETPAVTGFVSKPAEAPITAANYQLPQYWVNPVDLACGVLEDHGAMTEYLESVDDGSDTELVSYHDYKAFKEKLDGAQRHEGKQGNPASSVGAPSNTANVQESVQNTVKDVALSADVELDVNGLPWDARIHAGTKAKNADGSWRYMRGVDKENLVPEVEAELKQALAANQAAGEAEPQQPSAPPPPPQATQQAAPPPPTTTSDLKPVEELTLADAVAEVAGYKTKQLLTDKQADELAQVHGLNQFMLLATAPNLIAKVMTDVRQVVN